MPRQGVPARLAGVERRVCPCGATRSWHSCRRRGRITALGSSMAGGRGIGRQSPGPRETLRCLGCHGRMLGRLECHGGPTEGRRTGAHGCPQLLPRSPLRARPPRGIVAPALGVSRSLGSSSHAHGAHSGWRRAGRTHCSSRSFLPAGNNHRHTLTSPRLEGNHCLSFYPRVMEGANGQTTRAGPGPPVVQRGPGGGPDASSVHSHLLSASLLPFSFFSFLLFTNETKKFTRG